MKTPPARVRAVRASAQYIGHIFCTACVDAVAFCQPRGQCSDAAADDLPARRRGNFPRICNFAGIVNHGVAGAHGVAAVPPPGLVALVSRSRFRGFWPRARLGGVRLVAHLGQVRAVPFFPSRARDADPLLGEPRSRADLDVEARWQATSRRSWCRRSSLRVRAPIVGRFANLGLFSRVLTMRLKAAGDSRRHPRSAENGLGCTERFFTHQNSPL